MKIKNINIALLCLISFIFFSCDNNDKVDPYGHYLTTIPYAYILNQGNLGQNIPGTLTALLKGNEVKQDVFARQNGIELGQGANHMLIYGSKIYITVTNSSCIQVTDLKARLIKTIHLQDNGQPSKPRYVVGYQNSIYVSCYNGHVKQIDTLDFKQKHDILVSSEIKQLEEEVVANNSLYVSCSDYFVNAKNGNKIVKLGLPNLDNEKDISVAINPFKIKSDGKRNVYVMCLKANAQKYGTFERIDASDNVKILPDTSISSFVSLDDTHMLLLQSHWGSSGSKVVYRIYDTNNKESKESPLYTINADPTILNKLNTEGTSMKLDPITKQLYIVTSNIIAGNVYIFNQDIQGATFYNSFPTGVFSGDNIVFVPQENNAK